MKINKKIVGYVILPIMLVTIIWTILNTMLTSINYTQGMGSLTDMLYAQALVITLGTLFYIINDITYKGSGVERKQALLEEQHKLFNNMVRVIVTHRNPRDSGTNVLVFEPIYKDGRTQYISHSTRVIIPADLNTMDLEEKQITIAKELQYKIVDIKATRHYSYYRND